MINFIRKNSIELAQQMAGNKPIIEKTIPFLNDDVPKFLRNLRKFEEYSKKVKIIVK